MVGFFKRHPIIFALSYTLLYLSIFFILEKIVEPKYIIHCALDDMIPFCEYFIVPYLLWFLYIPAVFVYLVKKDIDTYWKLCLMMFGGMSVSVLVYILFPNGLTLRASVPNDNAFCRLVNLLYLNDTATNVCPSIHVLNTLSAHTALCHTAALDGAHGVKITSAVFALSVCLSTVFLDQHSVIDVLCAAVLCLIMGLIAYRQKEPAREAVHNS